MAIAIAICSTENNRPYMAVLAASKREAVDAIKGAARAARCMHVDPISETAFSMISRAYKVIEEHAGQG